MCLFMPVRSGLRRHRVLALMAEGLSNAAIGRRLFLNERAVSRYTKGLFEPHWVLFRSLCERRGGVL